jgi:hypothetical protein
MPKKLKSLPGVEIFSAGVWNGDEYSVSDLDEMVRAFKENPTQKPHLKLGHDDNQTLLQRDGLPAAGWIGNLYRMGEKLYADFIDIPGKIYDLMKLGAYKKVSAEIYWNAKVGSSMYKRLLGAVALLGADLPGVTNLNDIFDMYTLEGGEPRHYDLGGKCFTIEIDKSDLAKKETGQMDEKEKKALEDKIQAAEQKNHSLQSQLDAEKAEKEAMKKDVENLKTFAADAEKREKEAAEKAVEAGIDADVAALTSERLISPAMKPYVKALLGEEKKEYSFKPAKGDEKKFSKSGLLKEILKLHKATAVNTEEGSVEGEVENDEEQLDRQQSLHEKIEKYMADHKVSYKLAYKAVAGQCADEYAGAVDPEDGDDEDAD